MSASIMACASRGDSASVGPEPAASPEPAPVAPPEDRQARSEGRSISPTAARIYMLGEERYAEGRYPEAVALWGHAMLQLPPDPSVDGVRHKLIARMGHGLLQAYKASDDPAYLHDGKQMCELYLAKHEALFGETEDALRERGEIYELLYELEWRLEHEATAEAPQGGGEAPAVVAEASAPKTEEPAARPDSEVEESKVTEVEAGIEIPEEGEGELHRFIRVRKVQWARFDDPRVMKFLRDPRDTGPSLLDVGGDLVHGPRVLVRAGGLPRAFQAHADATTRKAARRVGFDLIEAARPELRRCYEVAMARDPVMVARVEVQLTVEPDGRVKQPLLVGGSLVDAEGDACMAKALRDAMVQEPALAEPLAIVMPIQFFHEDAQTDWELIWRERKHKHAYAETAGEDPMPPIDWVAHPRAFD